MHPSSSTLARRAARVLVAAALLAASLPAGATSLSPYGINVHAPAGLQLDQALDAVEKAGIGWIRVDLVWAAVELQPGMRDWRVYDAIAAEAAERGISVLATIAYTPAWATDGPPLAGVPRDPATWTDFCSRAARRYQGRIAAWEVWNEPNLDKFWAGGQQQYLDVVLRPCADAIHAADPSARVGGPGLAHTKDGDSDWYRWLHRTLADAADRLDFVTHHAYDEDGPRDVTEKLDDSTPFRDDPVLWDAFPPSLREVLERVGWQGPVWLTETGWASDRVGEGRQRDYLDGLLRRWLTGDPQRSWIDKIFVYELRDDPRPGIPRWGLLAADGREKPAFGGYAAFIAEHPPDEGPALALGGGRFEVRARWRDPRTGAEGFGFPLPFSGRTGFFWFFGETNVELIVKVLDGGPVNGYHWVFYGALTDVEYWLTVTDTATGSETTYHNPPYRICGRGDTTAFPAPSAASASMNAFPEAAPPTWSSAAGATGAAVAAPCLDGGGGLCLAGGRFRVVVDWRDQRTGATGGGGPIPGTDHTGYFWFFRPDNLELAVKVLDGRGANGFWWVLFGGLSDVEYRVAVTDLQTGVRRDYVHAPGTICGHADTTAF